MKAGLQGHWRITDTLTIKEQKWSSEGSRAFLQTSSHLGHCQRCCPLWGRFPRLLVNPSKKYPVSLVQRRVFSLIPDPILLTAKISHYTLLRALSTLFLCIVATSFFWILIITPWVCGALIWNIGGFREMVQWLTVLITKPDNLS